MPSEDVFATGRARQKKWLITGGVSAVGVAILALGFTWYFSTARLVDANAATFHRLRKEYCAVAAAIASDPKLGTLEVPSQVRVPWLVSLYGEDGRNVGSGANAEVVELPELEWLCSGTPVHSGSIEKVGLGKRIRADEFQSSLSDIYDREKRPYLRYKGVNAVLPFFRELRYLAIIESKRSKEKGSETLATVSLFRLDDAKRLSRVELELAARQLGTGAWVHKGENVVDVAIGDSFSAAGRSHQKAIADRFQKEGIDFAFTKSN